MPPAAVTDLFQIRSGRGGYNKMHGYSLSQELAPREDLNLNTFVSRLGPARARDGTKKLAFAFNAGYQAGKQVAYVTSAIKSMQNANTVQHSDEESTLSNRKVRFDA